MARLTINVERRDIEEALILVALSQVFVTESIPPPGAYLYHPWSVCSPIAVAVRRKGIECTSASLFFLYRDRNQIGELSPLGQSFQERWISYLAKQSTAEPWPLSDVGLVNVEEV